MYTTGALVASLLAVEPDEEGWRAAITQMMGPLLKERLVVLLGSGYLLGTDKKLEDFIRNILWHVLWTHVSA